MTFRAWRERRRLRRLGVGEWTSITATFLQKHPETLRPNAVQFVGRRLDWTPAGTMDDGAYRGHRIWMPTWDRDRLSGLIGWVPTEDLADIVAAGHIREVHL